MLSDGDFRLIHQRFFDVVLRVHAFSNLGYLCNNITLTLGQIIVAKQNSAKATMEQVERKVLHRTLKALSQLLQVQSLTQDLQSALARLQAAQRDASATAETSAQLIAQNQGARNDIRELGLTISSVVIHFMCDPRG